MHHRDAASGWQERGARSPLELRVPGGQRQRRLLRGSLRICKRARDAYNDQGKQPRLHQAAEQSAMTHGDFSFG
jgi:hypothetical protein